MKLYLLDSLRKPSQFAMFAALGTWSEGESLCPECQRSTGGLTEPLQIEWMPGTERIGDFSWSTGDYHCLVNSTVRQFCEAHGYECAFGTMQVVPPTTSRMATFREESGPGGNEPPRFTHRRMPRLPYPYPGPDLYWLRPQRRVPLNVERSGVHLEQDCSSCGRKRYTFKREGLVIDSASWDGANIFRIQQFERSAATFITEPALAALENEGFTNLAPKEAGVITGKG